jgi:formate dehydrogenase alpha subunit
MINLTINGVSVAVEPGTTVLEAARSIGIDIPNFCYDKDLTPSGSCRICIVEIEGLRNLDVSCSTMVREGMIVHTESKKVVEYRKTILDLLLSDHPEDCLTCEKNGACKLQDYCYRYNVKRTSFNIAKKELPIDDENHLIRRDPNKCILCGKCVKVCEEVQGTNAISFVNRGIETIVTTAFDLPLSTENCRFCGQCIDMCPTGALINKQMIGTRPWDIKKVKTTCPFCGSGCNFDLNIKDGKIVGVTGNSDSVVNGRSMCVKGRYHTDLIYSQNRITTPLIKKDGEFVEATWDEALDLVSSKFKEIKEKHGSDAFAALSSARCTNEDNWVMQKFMRAVIGTNNVDHCART